MKTAWIQFDVPDDARPEQIAEAIELMFRLDEGSVVVYDTPRAVVDVLRSPDAADTTMSSLREAAADTVHISYDYGQDVASIDPWVEVGNHLEARVRLRSPDPSASDDEATLVVAFEPGTAIVLDATLNGRVRGPGRRLDPLLVDTEEMVQIRMASATRAFDRLAEQRELTPVSAWYLLDERAAITYARDVATPRGPARVVATFRAGSRQISDFNVEDA